MYSPRPRAPRGPAPMYKGMQVPSTYRSPYTPRASSPRRAPFDRKSWLARADYNLKTERTRLYAPTLQTISPVLLAKQKRGQLRTTEFFEAIEAYRVGGDAYAAWSLETRKELLKPRPASEVRAELLESIARKSKPRPGSARLPPVDAMAAAGAAKKARPQTASARAAGTDPGRHVDHALEMWRNGKSAGGIYQFDGDIDDVGEGDAKPVSDQELEQAHDMIRAQITTKFKNLRQAFQKLDEDRSGKLSRVEALRMLMQFNLSGVREAVINRICDIVDKDGDGIEFDEFCDMMISEDALPLAGKK